MNVHPETVTNTSFCIRRNKPLAPLAAAVLALTSLGALAEGVSDPAFKPTGGNSLQPALVAPKCSPPPSGGPTGGKLKIAGNRMVNVRGQNFIPYGVSVAGGLQQEDWHLYEAADMAQIEAAPYWHSNTVRLQISQKNLFTNVDPSVGYNERFLQAVVRETDVATRLGMYVVENLQTEFTGNSPSPTKKSVRFWQVVAPALACRPNVIFGSLTKTGWNSQRSIRDP